MHRLRSLFIPGNVDEYLCSIRHFVHRKCVSLLIGFIRYERYIFLLNDVCSISNDARTRTYLFIFDVYAHVWI